MEEEDHRDQRERYMQEAYIYRLRMQELRARRTRIYAAAAATIFALVGSITAFFTFSRVVAKRDSALSEDISRHPAVVAINSEIVGLRSSIEDLRTTLTKLNSPPPETALAARQSEISTQLNAVDQRLGTLEKALQENPEKALSLPLLRKDLNELSTRSRDDRAANETEFVRLYSQQTWILGGIGTVLLAVAGGAITILLKSLPKPKDSEQDGPPNT